MTSQLSFASTFVIFLPYFSVVQTRPLCASISLLNAFKRDKISNDVYIRLSRHSLKNILNYAYRFVTMKFTRRQSSPVCDDDGLPFLPSIFLLPTKMSLSSICKLHFHFLIDERTVVKGSISSSNVTHMHMLK